MNKFCNEISEIEDINDIFFKRNDKLKLGKVNGGKAQSAAKLIHMAASAGFNDIVTTGSRLSPQCEIVSHLCEYVDINAHLFMPGGKDTEVIKRIKENGCSTLHQPLVRGSYQNVLNSYADRYANENGFYSIPFGMQNQVNVDIISKQCQNIPKGIKRIVVPVGSGMSFCGILNGLIRYHQEDIELVGIITGGINCFNIVNVFKPKTPKIKYRFEYFMPQAKPRDRYGTKVDATISDIKLDSIYEGKCVNFLQKGDLFWIVGYHEI